MKSTIRTIRDAVNWEEPKEGKIHDEGNKQKRKNPMTRTSSSHSDKPAN